MALSKVMSTSAVKNTGTTTESGTYPRHVSFPMPVGSWTTRAASAIASRTAEICTVRLLSEAGKDVRLDERPHVRVPAGEVAHAPLGRADDALGAVLALVEPGCLDHRGLDDVVRHGRPPEPRRHPQPCGGDAPRAQRPQQTGDRLAVGQGIVGVRLVVGDGRPGGAGARLDDQARGAADVVDEEQVSVVLSHDAAAREDDG